MGFYTTDDVPSGSGMGFTYAAGNLKAAVIFEDNITHDYLGATMTHVRFALASATDILSVFVCTVGDNFNISNPDISEPLAEIDMMGVTTRAGWNTVELPSPITITKGTNYFIGFEYVQTTRNYPLLTDYSINAANAATYGFLVYGDLLNGTDWYRLLGGGNLCIQALVEGENTTDLDIALSNLSVDKYTTPGTYAEYTVSLQSAGMTTPSSYTLDIALDGDVVKTVDTPIALSKSKRQYNDIITLPSDIAVGQHSLSISVATIDGKTPTDDTSDDSVSTTFGIYDATVERQKCLIEHFTSMYYGYGPLGTAVVDKMISNEPGKYAPVSMFYNYSTYIDPYALGEASEYIRTFSGNAGLAYAAFNRCVLQDTNLNEDAVMGIPIGYYSEYTDLVADMISEAIDNVYARIPAFTSVDITTSFDDSSRALYVHVRGDGVSVARQLLADNRLTVYITEDSIAGLQRDYEEGNPLSGYMSDYTHNYLLREIVSEPWGDDIQWLSDSAFEADYVVTLPSSWDASNISVVAFVSTAMATESDGVVTFGDMNNACVNNANVVHIRDVSTAIKPAIADADDVYEVARYGVDGRRMAHPTKGINIVRYSDGTTKKVLVR